MVQWEQSLLLIKDGNVGIGTTSPASTLTVVGNFSATGTKSAVVNTSYGIRKLYAMESPDIRFYDQGISSLNNGIANISLDPIFIETVEPDYIVYLTPKADTAGIYVAETAKEYFIVKGRNPTSSIQFSWLISAMRKGYSATRLDSERKEGAEITAVIDEKNKVTEIEIKGNEISKTNNEKVENKFTAAATDENDIIIKISEKTNLDKEQIKKSITFKRKQPLKQETNGEEKIDNTAPQYANYMSKINGSIILKLG